ncbi:hypothetical protein Goshw_013228 [Gossypium schwendimanii]|uniref:Uncharacterized protein n=1 Tax=Gossypium schwendimanii TaxID=34291 RepID=A0A7J9MY73_GOSSC|nr:hypothetical protein [Gossypium schwendimanii]
MSRKFLIGISHEDGLKMLKNTCMVVMLKILYERDMKVEKELTKLGASKNHELKENETNARAVIRPIYVKGSIIEELSSNDDNGAK